MAQNVNNFEALTLTRLSKQVFYLSAGYGNTPITDK